MALRYVTEERMRNQLGSLGVDMPPMVPYYASVLVKRKRWHDAGVLAPPYVEGKLISPSPTMFNGWVVRSQEGRVLHVREALLPDPVGEEVALELQELEKPPLEFEEPPKRRIHGKQRPVDMPRIMIPPSPDNYHPSPGVDDADYSPTTVADADDSPRLFSLEPKMLFGGETLGKDNEVGMETEKSRYINTSDLIQRNKVKENGGEVGMETEKSRYINTSDLIQRNKVKENGEVGNGNGNKRNANKNRKRNGNGKWGQKGSGETV